jgi:tryptophanyl-tRNA synthetase
MSNIQTSIDQLIEANKTVVTPWEVKGIIDYNKLIKHFGCDPIDGNLIKRFEQVTKVKAHTWLRRGLFFSNKDLSKILDDYEVGKPVYLYTGRGPSSEHMHIGHMVPFLFTKFLQDALQAVLIIQMSDDEKYYFKSGLENKPVEHYNSLAFENAKDIIACGFNPDKTFIFSNFNSCGGALYQNCVRVLQSVTGTRIKAIYGLDLPNTNGQLCWPSFQCAPAYSNSFPNILHRDGPYTKPLPDGTKFYIGPHIRCLVPMAIDQDPYFRMARDFVDKHKKDGYIKPATIHSRFLTALEGPNSKMSSTGNSQALFLSDTPTEIKNKIKKHAYSGGQSSIEEHRKYGGDLNIDVPFQYLLYLCDDDNKMREIAQKYRSGEMLTGEIKTIMIEYVTKVITDHQKARSEITDEILSKFCNSNRIFDMTRVERPDIELESDEAYAGYGINFDKEFGSKINNAESQRRGMRW